MNSSKESENNLRWLVTSLRGVTLKARILSLLIPLLALATLFAEVYMVGIIDWQGLGNDSFYRHEHAKMLSLFYSIVTGLAFSGLGCIVFFSILKKQGMAYYEEVANEVEWGTDREHRGSVTHSSVPLEVRYYINSFLKATELPVVGGVNGPLIYFLLFLLMILIAILLKISVHY